jgi:hypothetical protein
VGTKQKSSQAGVSKTKEKPLDRKDLLITATLGDKSSKEAQRLYNVMMPVAIKGKNIGYIVMSIADDYKAAQKRNHLKRVLSMVFAFVIGIIISLFIAEKYTAHQKDIPGEQENRSRRVGEDPQQQEADEIGVLGEASMKW